MPAVTSTLGLESLRSVPTDYANSRHLIGGPGSPTRLYMRYSAMVATVNHTRLGGLNRNIPPQGTMQTCDASAGPDPGLCLSRQASRSRLFVGPRWPGRRRARLNSVRQGLFRGYLS